MSFQIRVYDTLSKQKKPLETVVPGKVGIYLCGPTVYDKAHIGHMVGPVIFDAIKRYLVYSGYEVTWVVNITDVDDKLIHKARELGISMAEVAERNIRDYLDNLAGMGVDQIDHMPKATENMDEIIRFVESLIEQGFAYEADGDVFFDCGRDPEYGKLTNRTLESIQGDGGGAAAKKRSAADFALWKAAKPEEPSWPSPWGAGRPGWHIECSAMSRRLLGETFDIHGGGLDLVFPHHENEIAQSECCHGKPMARYWMHNGLLRASAAGAGKIGGRSERRQQQDAAGKMSRSKGAGGLAEQIERIGGETIRFFLLRTHYRSTVLFGEEEIAEAAHGLEAFYRFFQRYQRVTGEDFYRIEPPADRAAGDARLSADGAESPLGETAAAREEFLRAMDDDFNTAAAIGALFELVRTLNKFIDTARLEEETSREAADLSAFRRAVGTLRELARTLGLFLKPVRTEGADDRLAAGLMELIIELRAEARKNKDWPTADRIRDGLARLHVTLEDRAGGTEWRVEK